MTTTVAMTIAGRPYRLACGPGEERRLRDLGRLVDQTIGKLRNDFGEIGDSRLTIMTAIKIADDLFEANRRIAELESQLASRDASRTAADFERGEMTEEIADALDAASARVERIVRHLREAGEGQRVAVG